MTSNEQDIRTKRANSDKHTIVDYLNEMYRELIQTQGIYRFWFDEEKQMIFVDFGEEELTEVYVKGWSPAMVIKRVFDEICERVP